MNAIAISWRKLVHITLVRKDIADQLDTIESILQIEENVSEPYPLTVYMLGKWLREAGEAGLITAAEYESLKKYIIPLAIRHS